MRKLAALFGVFVAIFALYVLQKSLPTYGDITSPIAVFGKTGERVTARNFELTVTQLRFVRNIKLTAFGNERSYGTSGIWAIVEAEAAARNETVTVMSRPGSAPTACAISPASASIMRRRFSAGSSSSRPAPACADDLRIPRK